MQPTMTAWRLDGLGGPLTRATIPVPTPRPGSVLVRIEAAALLSYQRDYLDGKLPHYSPPDGPFTIGSYAVGTIAEIGPDVWHLAPGQRVLISPHFVAAENVAEPAQILLGLTAYGDGKRVQAAWRDGTFADYALAPAASLTPVGDGIPESSVQLIAIQRLLVPYGGLVRGRLVAGETVIVTGATGSFGTGAVAVALAMGAARVVAAGRDRDALARVALISPRVAPVALTGDVAVDTAALRAAAGGGAQLAFDIVGRATTAAATIAALGALRRRGRLVLMGSMAVPLPLPYGDLMMNDLEILGQFMYPREAARGLLELVRSRLLDLSAIEVRAFALADLRAALDAAAAAGNREMIAVTP